MIVQLNQTRVFFSAEYEFINSGDIIYTSSIPMKVFGVEIFFTGKNENLYKLIFNRKERNKNIFKSRLKRNMKPFIIENMDGLEIGSISRHRTKNFFGYAYYEINFEGSIYLAYEVGRGKEGIAIPIYKDGIEVSLIEKPPVVIKNRDSYTIYTENSKDFIPVALFSLYFDSIRFGRNEEYAATSVTYTYSYNKELLSKYNPEYKDKIVNMDRHTV